MTNKTMTPASWAAAVVAALALGVASAASAQVGVPGCTAPGPGSTCVYPNATTPTNCGAIGQPACCCVCPLGGQSGSCGTAPNSFTPYAPLSFVGQPMFQYELPQPIFYQPDTTTYPGFEYYEIQAARATNTIASTLTPFGVGSLSPALNLPDAFDPAGTAPKIWLGLVCPAGQVGCTAGQPLYTEVWGYGQTNNPAFPLNGAVTYPAMSFKATKGTPVKVKWVNALPDQHLLCKQPLNSNVPCAIDRTLMGTLTRENEAVNPFGSPMQPDNAMVVHLHGGEIPPDSDGLAELWFGNANSAAAYKNAFPTVTQNGYTQDLDPLFLAPAGNGILSPSPMPGPACNLLVAPPVTCPATAPLCYGNTSALVPGTCTTDNGNGTSAGDPYVAPNLLGSLIRPTGNAMIYNYPMVQRASTIWYHDHALGKTRINVVAGPAGYFYITDPAAEAALNLPGLGDCSNAGILAGSCYDIPIVLQDRGFNPDGSINYPNGLGQIAPPRTPGWAPLAPGVNPTVHPQTVPEYFGDFAVVNGVIWPKVTVEPRPYRFRFLDGSNARCYTLGLQNVNPKGLAPLLAVIASDQGYMQKPAGLAALSLCPGERFDVIIDFSGLANNTVTVTNTAGAPFPAGITPQAPGSPYAGLAQLLQFQVKGTCTGGCPGAWKAGRSYTGPVLPALTSDSTRCPWNGVTTGLTCQKILNEVADPTTAAPLRVQIDGKAFEDAVTEIPKRGTTEVWQIINTTVDAHPMHLHLVQFKVVSRQAFNVKGFSKAVGLPANAFNRQPLTPVDVGPYLMGAPLPPTPEEMGFKDTAKSFPGEILTLIAKWDGGWADNATAGTPFYQAVTSGPYVWHCHIVDHEDNEMMRPTLVMP